MENSQLSRQLLSDPAALRNLMGRVRQADHGLNMSDLSMSADLIVEVIRDDCISAKTEAASLLRVLFLRNPDLKSERRLSDLLLAYRSIFNDEVLLRLSKSFQQPSIATQETVDSSMEQLGLLHILLKTFAVFDVNAARELVRETSGKVKGSRLEQFIRSSLSDAENTGLI